MSGKIFLVTRNDGLGERLKAMLNAIVLADYFGVDFKIRWRLNPTLTGGGHCIVAAAATFDPVFIADHCMTNPDLTRFVTLKPLGLPLEDIRKLLDSAPDGIIVNQEAIERLVTGLDDLPGRLKDAWRRIDFASDLRDEMARAATIPLPPNAVALHLRAGDMIYGNFRLFDSYTHKALCYPVAKHIIEERLAAGQTPVIFGQDVPTCRLLAGKFGLKLASDLLDLTDDLGTALAEIVLMSRCAQIYAGVSGFSRVAELIGGGKIITPAGESAASVVDVIASDPDLYDPEVPLSGPQRAFAFYNLVHYGRDVVAPESLIEALDCALFYDRGNAFYAILKAMYETEVGKLDDAERTLCDMLSVSLQDDVDFKETTVRRVIKNAFGGYQRTSKMNLRPYLESLSRQPQYDRPSTLFIGQLARLAAEKGEGFEDEQAVRQQRVAQYA